MGNGVLIRQCIEYSRAIWRMTGVYGSELAGWSLWEIRTRQASTIGQDPCYAFSDLPTVNFQVIRVSESNVSWEHLDAKMLVLTFSGRPMWVEWTSSSDHVIVIGFKGSEARARTKNEIEQ